jgi:hypothetical protein
VRIRDPFNLGPWKQNEEDKKLKEAPDHLSCRSLKRVDHRKDNQHNLQNSRGRRSIPLAKHAVRCLFHRAEKEREPRDPIVVSNRPKQNSERPRFSVSGLVCNRKKGGPYFEQSTGGSRIGSAGAPIDNTM